MRSYSNSSAFILLLALFAFCSTILSSAIPLDGESANRVVLDYEPRDSNLSKLKSTPLVKRAKIPSTPSVDECKASLDVPRNSAVFYVGEVEDSSRALASATGGRTVWEAGLTALQVKLNEQYLQALNAGQEVWTTADEKNFFINCSKAFALLAAGDIKVVLPAGIGGKAEMPATSFFTKYEWPIIKDPSQTPDITSITAYIGNSGTSAPTGNGELLCRDS